MEIQKNKNSTKNSDKEIEKIRNIAEIQGLLDETHRGKDWIFQEMKKQSLKTSAKLTMNSFEILSLCPPGFVSHLLRVLKGDDFEDFEDVKTLTKTYHWFFTDIVAGSDPSIPTKYQVRKIMVLNELINRTEIFKHRDSDSTVILPTGDGMAIGFSDSPEKPLRLAIELQKAIFRYNQTRTSKDRLYIRVGIDMGPVYFVKDVTGKDNVWGAGIIMARRVMDLGGENQIFASARISEDISKLSPEYKSIMHPIGDYSIKHGEHLYIYNIYGDGFGNKIAPKKSKVAKSNLEKDIKTINNFRFNEIQVGLEVLDTKSMLTRHKWSWNIVNISKEPKQQIFYYLDGDAPKEFSDMNVSVMDERGNKLEILSVNVNKPYHKEFNVLLKNPLKPKQRKTLTLSYDWEEPQKTFFYKVSSDCKKFEYQFTIPKGIELRSRILKVDTETGYKIHASPPPDVKQLEDKVQINWSKTNLRAYEAYQFDW